VEKRVLSGGQLSSISGLTAATANPPSSSPSCSWADVGRPPAKRYRLIPLPRETGEVDRKQVEWLNELFTSTIRRGRHPTEEILKQLALRLGKDTSAMTRGRNGKERDIDMARWTFDLVNHALEESGNMPSQTAPEDGHASVITRAILRKWFAISYSGDAMQKALVLRRKRKHVLNKRRLVHNTQNFL
jgi:hypothetical protein